MPYNLDPRAIYYRKDLLEAAGLTPPTNWDELQAAAIAMHDPANGIAGIGFPAGDFHITQHFYMGFMFQAGGSILNKDGALIFGTEAKDANVQALTYLTDFATKHKVTPEGIAAWNTDDAHTAFVQGRLAMGMGTGRVIGQIMRENPDLFDKVGVLDTLQGPKAKLTAGFFNPMFIWKFSPNVDAAKTFVRWFVQPGGCADLCGQPGAALADLQVRVRKRLQPSEPAADGDADQGDPLHHRLRLSGTGIPEMGVIDGEKMFAAPVNEVVVGAQTPSRPCSTRRSAWRKSSSAADAGLPPAGPRRGGPAPTPQEKLHAPASARPPGLLPRAAGDDPGRPAEPRAAAAGVSSRCRTRT